MAGSPRSAASRPQPPRRSTGRRVFRILLTGLTTFVLAASAVLGYALYASRHEHGSTTEKVGRFLVSEVVPPELVFQGRARVNILLIGEDVTLTDRRQIVKEFSRSDTNILIGLDRLSGNVHILSLPRDTRVEVPGEGIHKLNAAHRLGGPALLMDTVRSNFGLQADHYLKTNFRGFVELVDLLGGIDVDVERDMNYDDSWQDFHVHLRKGYQHLTGEQAHGYVRWRKSKNGDSDPRGDLGRVERQQKVIKILARKALSPQHLPQVRSLLAAARKYIETDLSDKQLLSLALFISKINPALMDTATLPCDWRGHFMHVRPEEAVTLLSRMYAHTFDATRLRGGSAGSVGRTGVVLPDPQPSRLRALEQQQDEAPATRPAVPPHAADPPDREDETAFDEDHVTAPTPSPAPLRPTPPEARDATRRPREAPPAAPEPAPEPPAEPAPPPAPAADETN
ncbi:MAG: LCP family protein [Fimbriimonadaceae bacterium]|nr:LCP family protein [Fimbriimonadaceae bacterium]